MEVRLMGLPADVEEASRVLREAFAVLEERGPYANHGDSRLVRSYLKVMPRDGGPVRSRLNRPETEIDAPRRIGYSSSRRRRT